MIGFVKPAWIASGLVAVLLGAAFVEGAAGKRDTYGEYGEDEPLRIGTVIQRELEPGEGPLMGDAGLDSVRIWISWAEVETKRDDYDWAKVDRTVRQISAGGLTPVPFIFGSPEWAARQDGFFCNGPGCVPYAPVSPATRGELGSFAAAAVRRYGPGGTFWEHNIGIPYRPIDVWQLWNEPNLDAFYEPYVSPSRYAELVRVAAAAIRAEDPEAEIVLAGLSGNRTTSTHWSTQEYLAGLYDVPGVTASFDGIALHPYASRPRGVMERLSSARAIAAEHDPDVEVWVTEIGWASGGPKAWALVKTPGLQAKLLRRSFRRLIKRTDEWDLRGIYWYAWRDTPRGQAVCPWCGRAGLRDRHGDPKPAYDALIDITSK